MGGEGRRPPRWMAWALGILLVGLLVYALRSLLTAVLLAFLIAYLLDPVVDRLEARRIPRAAGITILLMALLVPVGVFLVLAVPGMARDLAAFVASLPQRIDVLLTAMEPFLARWDIDVPHTVAEALEQWEIDAQELAARAVTPAGSVLGWILGGTASVLGALAAALMVPVFAFYLLHDFDHMTAAMRDLTPWRYRARVVEVAREVDQVLGQFIRGQLLVMLILAVLYSLGYSLVGVRLALFVGLVAGLLSFIPYVGGAVALGLALLMSVLDWGGWGQILGVVAVYTVIQLLEGFVITPRVVGDKVGVPAVWVLFALMAGGELFGFLGVLLALPMAAVMKIFIARGVESYRRSPFFLKEAPSEAAGTDASAAPERDGG